MSHSPTAAPEASIFCAAAKPMPLAPPVTMAMRPLRSMAFMANGLELHPVGALEAQHLPCLGGRGDLVAELLDDAADLCHLLGIAGSELAGPDIERVLQANAHIAADHRRIGAEIHLMAAAGQHRPQIILAEQPVGGALHEEQIVEIGADAAEDAEDQL